ncbi:MAG: aminotransferase class I/II-fold pyridoxal phosphate-dependent enzyme [Alphaproteobacteria bacterium]|nr:aminotransferase class I/II-fold pyridoxal phosphate-dependent enzyme [Alphaproteobacteria bacterium]
MPLELSRRGLLRSAGGLAGASVATLAFARTEGPAAASNDLSSLARLGPAKGVADLSRNENPYGPAPSALRMVEYAGKRGAYYPTDAEDHLGAMIAEKHNVAPEQVVVTSGSSEALCALSIALGRNGPVVAPRLFFDYSVVYGEGLGLASLQRVAMKGDLATDLGALEARVSDATGFVQLCNPNNPTGELIPGATLKPAVRRMAARTTVVVDEAYMELADDPVGNSCVDLVREGLNVIVTRTFSKIYGMAGLRVGYAIAAPEMAAKIRQARMTWISGTGLAAAIGSYNDERFLAMSLSKIVEGREMVKDAIASLGLEALPTSTNFVYFKTGRQADEVRADFAARNIVVRGAYMDYTDYTRVSMGRLEDIEKFTKALPMVVGA